MEDIALAVLVAFISVLFGMWGGVQMTISVADSDCEKYGKHTSEKYVMVCTKK